jgi:O-methyltransferase
VYALDSYGGFDDVADMEATYLSHSNENNLLKKGAFSGTSDDLIRRRIRMAGLDGTVIPIRGYFRDTLPRMPDVRYCFVHLDCDLGTSYQECLEYFYPRVVHGGFICFDEYRIQAWPLTTRVIDDFFSDKPEKPTKVVSVVAGRRCERWHVRKG